MTDFIEKQSVELLGELEELRVKTYHQSNIITALECQMSHKDKQIERLHQAFEEEQSLFLMSENCCSYCEQKDEKIKYLEEQLKAAVMKQHEAMNRALYLAERNQRLERELKDIDNMALAVETECQNKVKQSLRNMDNLEEKLRHKIDEIRNLESMIVDMKNKIERDGHELNSLKTDKKFLEENLSLAVNEKKNLNDKVNNFLLIEKNLTSEILRLQEINKKLQQKILCMEERLMNVLGTNCKGRLKEKQKQQELFLGVSHSKTHSTMELSSTVLKPFKEDEKSCNDYSQIKSTLLDKVQQERNFYHNECHRLREIIGTLNHHSNNSTGLMRQLKDQENEIKELKQEAYTLRHENSFKRFECGDQLSCSSGESIKIILDRLEKERDMALSDMLRLQEERDALKEKIKVVAESQLGEQARLERILGESEERIRRLESERRELISNQSSHRVALAAMEEKFDEYKEQARCAQTALIQTTASYNQLKTLQEQTDRTLSDVQDRLSQTGIELRIATSKIKELEKEKKNLEEEISILKKEKFSLKASLAFTEKEKDGLLISLDEKTEQVAKLENEIKKQETYIAELTEKISHLEKKFEFALSEKTTREHGLRTLERAVEHLKEELEQCERDKKILIRENHRLQDDVASAAKDCLTARKNLDVEKQEVENLKKQLQQYVTEVKRAEELLTKKETERNQMLDHFRSLSLEATALETNNHTLESTVENTKTQLICANNKIMDLEHDISSKDSLLCGYEKQIADLTAHIAELETKLKKQADLRSRAEADLNALRGICSAVESQKEALRKQANSHDAEKIQLKEEVRRLSEEYEGLNEKLSYERSLSQTLEKSLSSSRQETLEHKITNKDLQSHVQHLRQKVDELTQKLESESVDVKRYQAQCTDLSQQVTELRREITNTRFEQAKAMEDSRRSENDAALQSEDDFSFSFSGFSPTSSRTFIQSTKAKKRLPFTSAAPPINFSTAQDYSLTVSPQDPQHYWPRCSNLLSLSLVGKFHGPKDFTSSPRETVGNFPQTYKDDALEKEIRFEAEISGRSTRNIPPLTFLEDSDRTISLDSDYEQPKNTFSRFEWKLSPLLGKSCNGKTTMLKGDTASELSSLPEDSEPRNDIIKTSISISDEKLTDFSVYPTYSVHGKSDSQSNNYRVGERRVQETGNEDQLGNLFHRDFSEEILRWEIGKSICTPCREPPGDVPRRIIASEFPALPPSPCQERSELTRLEECRRFQNFA